VTRKPVVFDSAASAEAEEAILWYRQRTERAAARFLAELDEAIEQISSAPNRFQSYEFGTRRILLTRFPYFVVFRETATQLEVVAVAHSHRRPGYWRERV
jgi:plasmid stabilization system protein ParE